MTAFDPAAAAAPGSGIFGLPDDERSAAVVLVPVPFAATVSYGGGAERGPAAILAASRQVDLYDLQFGRIYEAGVFLRASDPHLLSWHERARALCQPIVARGGAGPDDAAALAGIDDLGQRVNDCVGRQVEDLLAAGKIAGVVGGDHSVPFGAMRAAAQRHPGLGILHVDAHADLRQAYEGFRWSHASIMDNVLRELPGVARLVQVGIRDFSEDELRAIHGSDGRVVTHFDQQWQRRQFAGEPFDALCREAVDALPQQVWVSFDIDGLDPALCPHTGTPVPGGLSFAAATHLLEVLARSGRSIIGFDLVEVAPGPEGPDGQGDAGEWDANVGARLLYKLCGAAVTSRLSP